MTKKLILVAVLMLSITMVSCTTKPKDNANSNSDSNTTAGKSTDTADNDTDSTSKTDDDKPKEEATANKTKLSIYTIDETSLTPNESSTIEVNKTLSLEDKLKELSKTISEKNFDKLSIEVKSIDTVDNKKVATINLADTSTGKWVPKFQGSTGGTVTANTLIENFLQSNNKSKGEWIDGVKFLYNNETIEYDHVADLSKVNYAN